VAAQRGMPLRWQTGQKGMNIGVDAGTKLSPMRGSNRRAAVAAPAANRLDLQGGNAVMVHRLPHTAGMRYGSGDRQSRGGESAHEGENKQQSGGQAVHGWSVSSILVWSDDRLRAVATQVLARGIAFTGVVRWK
jgi:hypothetical protein